MPRRAALARESWRFGRIGQLERGPACALREALLRLTPPRGTQKRLEWIQGHEA